MIPNKGQEVATCHKDGPMMVIAGPGSGKTTVITRRAKHLIENYNVPPYLILVITYTKAAATHMQQRYNNICSGAVNFFTFHALFFKILREHTSINIADILKEEERAAVLKNILKENNIEWDEDTLQEVSLELSLIQNDQLDINHYNSLVLVKEDFITLVKSYGNYKKENNKIDFDDMLTRCYDLFINNSSILNKWQNKYKYIMIDEFQDINKVQYNIIKLLCSKNKNLYIVGDDDQSIYKFRGARPQFLLNFQNDFIDTKTAILDINYRSSEEIIKMANIVIIQNTMRFNKIIKGTDRKGTNPKLIKNKDIDSEAIYISNKIKNMNVPLNDICIVYRTNLQARALVDAFALHNMPYKIKDEMPSVYEHFVSKDLCSYMYLALNINDNVSFENIVNKPSRYINKGIISTLRAKAKKDDISLIQAILQTSILKKWKKQPIEDLLYNLSELRKLSPHKAIKYIRNIIGYNGYIKEYAAFKKSSFKGLYEILDELTQASKNFETLEDYLTYIEDFPKTIKETQNNNGVHLSTMHGVKGLEYSVVFIISCVETLIPHEKSKTIDEIEEERRLFYVAITRAKDILYLSTITNRHEVKMEPTRFLKGVIKYE